MTMDEKKSKETVARIKRNANVIYPGHDQPLYLNHPIDKEPISFEVRFANDKNKMRKSFRIFFVHLIDFNEWEI